MAKLNIKIETEEIKLSGILDTDEMAEGFIALETEEKGRINVSEILSEMNGQEIELNLKKKIETAVQGD